MIQLQDVSKSFGEKTLLDHVTWQVGDRDRVGLCGPNGAGKTTLLKMLAGLDEPDAGVIQKPNALTLGYLPQDGLSHSGRSVVDEASLAFEAPARPQGRDARARGAARRRHGCPHAEHDALLHRYSDVQDRFRMGDGYRSSSRSPRCCGASASSPRPSTSRPTTFRAAGRCASRWPSCC